MKTLLILLFFQEIIKYSAIAIFSTAVIFMVVFAIGAIYYLIDSIFLKKIEAEGLITKKEAVFLHGANVLVSIPGVGTAIPLNDIYNYFVEINITNIKQDAKKRVNNSLYNELKTDQKIMITYSRGRLSKNIYIKRIKPL